MYGLDTMTVKKTSVNKLEVTEMRNEYIKETIKADAMTNRNAEARLGWSGHGKRRGADCGGRRMMDLDGPGRRGEGRPSEPWKERTKTAMEGLRWRGHGGERKK